MRKKKSGNPLAPLIDAALEKAIEGGIKLTEKVVEKGFNWVGEVIDGWCAPKVKTLPESSTNATSPRTRKKIGMHIIEESEVEGEELNPSTPKKKPRKATKGTKRGASSSL